jgi:DNA-binding IclR family transcriptional regulator
MSLRESASASHNAGMERPPAKRRNTKASGERPNGIQVIARAAEVLRALEGEEGGLSLGQLAQRIGLPRSTVQRIVESLSAEQFVISAGQAGVRLGPALLRIAASTRLDFTERVRPILQDLSRELGETIDLSVLKGSGAVFVDQVPGSHRLRAVSAVGERFPLYCTANGKALLATLAPAAAEHLLREPFEELTPQTLTTASAVLREVEACRETGIAYDRQEHTEGISAVGTAYIDPMGRPTAISIPVPTSRFERRESELVERLLHARDRVTALLRTRDA